MDEVKEWIGRMPPDQREQVEWLAGKVHEAAPGADEALKWRRLTFTVGGDWHHWVCSVTASKRGVDLVFHKGALLEDPSRLLHGDADYVRSVPFEEALAEPEAVLALIRADRKSVV